MFSFRNLKKKAVPAMVLAAAVTISPLSVGTANAEVFHDFGSDGGYAAGVMQEISQPSAKGEPDMATPMWLSIGKKVRYPSGGGTWEYGFWNAKARSYYKVHKCHTSTVTVNDRRSKSINTRGGATSIAELWAINTPGAADRYYYNFC